MAFTSRSTTGDTASGWTVTSSSRPGSFATVEVAGSQARGRAWCASSMAIQCGRPLDARSSWRRGISSARKRGRSAIGMASRLTAGLASRLERSSASTSSTDGARSPEPSAVSPAKPSKSPSGSTRHTW